ncbi:hypothetical protein sscle_07g060600 [Sclerotinia sclerotiorum 1980 UF-70]|uniref:Protein kinase domain-containing protein n=1 Tax=Sclerotinia sclerotiorum (strain ATCC 18683 / 1980 / Ss-1) TaxID=665079 RepID=A0A1D9Q8K1_SCLS1|nr:hypothetical protein sscle_07g060600 [Sclerotinia sclerotiorum 1980 UF-70]
MPCNVSAFHHKPSPSLPPSSPSLPPSSPSLPPSPPSPSAPSDDMIAADLDEIRGPLEFRMGHRLVVATSAERIDPWRPVYRLKVGKSSILDYIPILFIRSIFERLFNSYPYLKTFCPGWFLPPTVILKKCKPDWEKEFENEKLMYHRLKSLQGRFLPYYYGEATYDGSPALVLSEVIGQTLAHLTIKPGEDEVYERKLEEVYKALTVYGVIHGDTKLDNAMDVGDRIVLIDLEQATIDETEWEKSTNKGNAGSLLRDLQYNRQWEDEARKKEERRLKEKAEAKAERRRLWELRHSNQRGEE